MKLDALVVKPSLWQALDKGIDLLMQSERPWEEYVREVFDHDSPNACAQKREYCSVGAAMEVGGFDPDNARMGVKSRELPPLTQDVIRALYFAIPRETRDRLTREIRGENGIFTHHVPVVREGAVVRYNDEILRNKDAIFRWWMFAQTKALIR